MKRLLAASLCFILLLVAMMVYISQIGRVSSGGGSPAPAYRLSLVVPLVGNRYWNAIEESAMKEGLRRSIDVKCSGPIHLSQTEQIAFIRQAIAAQVDGIVTSGCDSDDFRLAIDEARAHRIPVVLVDADTADSARVAYIGTDNVLAGAKIGGALVGLTGGAAKIAVLVGTMGDENQKERLSGFTRAIAGYRNMSVERIIEGKSDLPLIIEKVNELLDQRRDVDTIICLEGFGPVGTGKVLQSRNLVGAIRVIGFDDLEETIDSVRHGAFYATIIQEPDAMGVLAVGKMADVLSGKWVDPACQYTDVRLITREKAAEIEKYR